MTIDKCNPCGCIEGTIPWDTYKQQFLLVACQILAAAHGSKGTGIGPCAPCNCLPGYIPDDVFKQASLQVMCQILEALS